MNGHIGQRMLAIGIVAILLLLACASAVIAAPEQLIPGKVFVLKADKSGGVKLIFKTKADMTFQWNPCSNGDNNEEVQISLERPNGTYYDTTIPVADAIKCPFRATSEIALFDDGRCKLKWKISLLDVERSSIKIICVIPEFAFSPVVGASFIFVQDNIPPASMGACFADPVLGLPNSAVVKKDGSDGKTFKMVDAPLAACDGF